MEYLDLVCAETGRPLGQQAPRHEVIAKQLWCQSTNIFVLNEFGEILVHQRSKIKERHPGVWSTHLGGHVGAGETFESNALKELQEESGITVDEKSLVSWRTSKIEHARLWVRDFVTVVQKNAITLIPQPGEVDQFNWLTLGEILKLHESEPHNWLIGTHHFPTEYACLRAVSAAAQTSGALNCNIDLTKWNLQIPRIEYTPL